MPWRGAVALSGGTLHFRLRNERGAEECEANVLEVSRALPLVIDCGGPRQKPSHQLSDEDPPKEREGSTTLETLTPNPESYER